MSVYNSADFLSEAIESILNQTYKNFEFLIIDDCSTDNSPDVIKSFQNKDERINFFRNKHREGLTKNLNKLNKIATGKYLARMDADDIAYSSRFEKQMKFLYDNPKIEILGSYAKDIDHQGNILSNRKVPIEHEKIIKLLPILSPIIHPTVFIKKETFDFLNGYNEKYDNAQDLDLWFRAYIDGFQFHNLPDYLLYYRVKEDYSFINNFKKRMNDVKVRINGYKQINYPMYKYYNIIISIILAIIPYKIFKLLKNYDPRTS